MILPPWIVIRLYLVPILHKVYLLCLTFCITINCKGQGALLVRDPDELVGRTGSGSRTRVSFFPDRVPG